MARIELGDEVRDTLSGVTGIAIGRTTWITGCDNIQIRPQGMHDGRPIDTFAADEPIVEIVEKAKVKVQVAQTPRDRGGPSYGAAKMTR